MMKCKEFKKNLVELCDKNADPELVAEYMQHMEECAECKSYYDDYMATVNMLRPHHTPVEQQTIRHGIKKEKNPSERMHKEKRNKFKLIRRKAMQIAASLIIFVAGVGTGLSNLFSSDAKAITPPSTVFAQAIQNLHNVGSFVIHVYARTLSNENLAYFDPDADFVEHSLKVLHQNDSIFWRFEKEDERTIVFDGKEQYMWQKNGTKLRGPAEATFLEGFTSLLNPEKLLEQQKTAISNTPNANIEMRETDSTTIVIAHTEIYDNNLTPLLNDSEVKKYKGTIEYVFTKKEGLLKKVQIWVERNGEKIVIFKSSDIEYNTFLSKEALLQLPDADSSQWLQAEEPHLETGYRLSTLQKETATEAARRIITALTTGELQQAEEVLYYYSQELPQLTKELKGCQASEFSAPKHKDDYAGVYIFYRLTCPDGTSDMRHVALRCDNDQKIWILDGGF